jgi:hypothetical protein
MIRANYFLERGVSAIDRHSTDYGSCLLNTHVRVGKGSWTVKQKIFFHMYDHR